jgi:hypothetical protein
LFDQISRCHAQDQFLIALFCQRQKAPFPLDGNNRKPILHAYDVMAVAPLTRNKNLGQFSRFRINPFFNIGIISRIAEIPPIIVDQVNQLGAHIDQGTRNGHDRTRLRLKACK